MKIQINENETYDLSIPSIVSIRELAVIINKFQQIYRIASKMDVFDQPENQGEVGEQSQTLSSGQFGVYNKYISRSDKKICWNKLREDKNLLVKVLYAFYNTKGEDALRKVFEENGLKAIYKSRVYMSNPQWQKFKKQVKPSELNLIRMPKKGELISTLRIKPINENGTTANK